MDAEYLSTDELKVRESELKKTIAEYRDILEQKIDAARNLASYHKILGKLYLDNRMFMLASEQFDEAVKIDSENPVLFYYGALCYSRYSKSLMNESEQYSNILIAEKYYLKTIELDRNFNKALYAIAVLYIFELDQPDKAVEYLEQLLETQKSNYDAMFLLANAYIRLGITDQAVDIYNSIIRTSKNSVYKKQAEDNKRQLQDSGYGWN
jgi:tetratricopeptide (TPR) repeat protein